MGGCCCVSNIPNEHRNISANAIRFVSPPKRGNSININSYPTAHCCLWTSFGHCSFFIHGIYVQTFWNSYSRNFYIRNQSRFYCFSCCDYNSSLSEFMGRDFQPHPVQYIAFYSTKRIKKFIIFFWIIQHWESIHSLQI